MPKNIATGTASTSPIRNCSWGYKCEKTWGSLIVTDSDTIRFCDACEKEVYLCKTKRELADSVLLNRCVAFSSRLLKASDALAATNIDDDYPMLGNIQSKYV
jgi:hypothetical protein